VATSNSFNFALTRDDIILAALQQIGIVGEGETPSTSQTTETALMLNMIVKLRAADGMPQWSLKRGILLPVTSVSSVNTTSHVVTTYRTTTTSAASASGASTITVTAVTGILNGDQIGVEITGGVQWTTVSGAPAGSVVTLAATLTAAVASGARVYAYTASSDRIQRPLRLVEANLLYVPDNTSHDIDIVSRQEYFALGTRTSASIPNQIFYDASLGSATADPTSTTTWYGTIYLYPRFNDGKYAVEFTYHRPFADFDVLGDHPDFPQEFYLPLTLELAAVMGARYGVPIEVRRSLMAEAKSYREEALSTVYPEGSLRIEPNIRT
jgi:hypothetical protein